MDASKISFYEKYKWYAIWNHILYGVPASITLAQAALESNYGESWLARVAKNFFGIKGYSNPDNRPLVYANDDTANEPFRSYPSVKDSFKDHSKFLLDNQRYSSLFDSNNVYTWAYGLQNKGYATSPTYANTLIGKINDYDLEKYDFWGNNKTLILVLGGIALIIVGIIIYKIFKKIKTK